MATKYLDLTGLTTYDTKIKEVIDESLATAKTYAETVVSTNADAAGTAATLIAELVESGQVATNTAAIATLNSDSTTEGSVAYQLAALKAEISASAYDDTELDARVSANESAIETLNSDSTVEGSVAYQIAQIVADAPEAYDTLVEIATWITSHAESASAMNASIEANADDIAELQTLIGSLPETTTATTIVAYIQAVLAEAESYADDLASNYATAAQGALADTALQASDITTGTENGTISVSGTNVAVYGLGSAAYTDSSAYATADQGALADTALQPSDIEAITEEEITALFTTATE